MTNLSPAAQAVLDAANKAYWLWDAMCPADADAIAAAALRAAALHVYSEAHETCGGASYALMIDVDDLLAIAAELEGAGGQA